MAGLLKIHDIDKPILSNELIDLILGLDLFIFRSRNLEAECLVKYLIFRLFIPATSYKCQINNSILTNPNIGYKMIGSDEFFFTRDIEYRLRENKPSKLD